MLLFDRSWYNRAGVGKVMGFCSDYEHLEFLRQAPEPERMLVNSGIILLKYWFSVSREEQFRRFKSRQTDPLKQWKLSPVDRASLASWGEYSKAKDCPWVVIRSDDKKRGRINCMRHFLSTLNYADKNKYHVRKTDSSIVGSAKRIHERDENVG